MGSKRGANPSTSSFDLFLDTICNAFGGIVFIAILSAVMAQMKGGGNEKKGDSDSPQVTKEQAVESAKRSEELQAERMKLATLVKQLESQQLSGTPEIMQKLKMLEETQAKLDAIVTAQAAANQKLSEIQVQTSQIQSQVTETERKHEETKSALDDRSQSLDDKLNASVQKVQLPKAHDTTKANVLIALRFGKLYCVSDLSNPSSKAYDLNHIEKFEENQKTRIRPKPTAGWAWSDKNTLELLKRALANVDRDNYFITIIIWPDTFDVFRDLKVELVRLGYEYDTFPLADVQSVPIGQGSGAQVQ